MTAGYKTQYWFDPDKYMPVQCHYQYNPNQEDHAQNGGKSMDILAAR